MVSTSLLTAIIAALPLALASPIRDMEARDEPGANAALAARAAPRFITGPWQNFPAISTWGTFDQMFEANKNSMRSTGSTWDDIGRINVAIRDAATLGVDERVILGIIMQESHGDVGVRTTTSPDGGATAGLMQCTGCPGFPGRHGLSQAEITSMVRGGTQHYKQNLVNWGNKWSGESIYPALREYNSGSVNVNNLSDGRGATPSYVSDIAQRFTGWVD
ncbi:hypothetical protein B0T25DRAFT_590111 [Lasiosphaeria hispida]|uniref:Transglycosylase SLT domain-containing protein n=1 Tax=Lasiosphaeria hispida TaxID=260671 RepID=A0AAJ0HNF0_9PEZI|nr:hypothetical protein B0T25DRAFT_590111 [Lasiosphaeria hispida]